MGNHNIRRRAVLLACCFLLAGVVNSLPPPPFVCPDLVSGTDVHQLAVICLSPSTTCAACLSAIEATVYPILSAAGLSSNSTGLDECMLPLQQALEAEGVNATTFASCASTSSSSSSDTPSSSSSASSTSSSDGVAAVVAALPLLNNAGGTFSQPCLSLFQSPSASALNATAAGFGAAYLSGAVASCLSLPKPAACLAILGSFVSSFINQTCDVQLFNALLAESPLHATSLQELEVGSSVFYTLAALLLPQPGGSLAGARSMMGTPCLSYSGLLPASSSTHPPKGSDAVARCNYFASMGCCMQQNVAVQLAVSESHGSAELAYGSLLQFGWSPLAANASAYASAMASSCTQATQVKNVSSSACTQALGAPAPPSPPGLPPASPANAATPASSSVDKAGSSAAIAISVLVIAGLCSVACVRMLRRSRRTGFVRPSGGPVGLLPGSFANASHSWTTMESR